MVQSPVAEVFARGAVRVDPRIGEAGDVDTAVTVLTHEDGTLTTIDNSREAVYGFDQRVEAFGSGGMAVSDNPARHAGWHVGREARTGEPLPVVLPGPLPSSPTARSGRRSTPTSPRAARRRSAPPTRGHCTAVALAAGLSLREGRPVQVKEIG